MREMHPSLFSRLDIERKLVFRFGSGAVYKDYDRRCPDQRPLFPKKILQAKFYLNYLFFKLIRFDYFLGTKANGQGQADGPSKPTLDVIMDDAMGQDVHVPNPSKSPEVRFSTFNPCSL